MGALREWVGRFLGTLRLGRQDRDLEAELRFHMEMAAEHARRHGASADEAGRAARLREGGLPQALEALRDQRGWPLLSGVVQDARVAIRSLRKTPIVTSVAIA